MFMRRSIEMRILEYLERKGGSATDREIYEYIRKSFDVSKNQFHHILMSLEIEGFIAVRSLKEDTRIIILKQRVKR